MSPTSTEAPQRRVALSPEALEFAPGLLAIQESPPARMPRAVFYVVGSLLALMMLWASVGRLDIVATADGKLIPATYLKLVQPADAGIVKEILVHEGERVQAGQVLLRLDPQDAQADAARLDTDFAIRALQLRRIDAELSGKRLLREPDDPPDLFKRIQAQYVERHQAYVDSEGQVEQQVHKAQRDYDSGVAVLQKLEETNPILKAQSEAYAGLGGEGYVPKVTVSDKQRAYIENQQDLAAQRATVAGLDAAVSQASEALREVHSKYRSDLENERVEAQGEYDKLKQDLIKQKHRSTLLELRSPQAGVIKDLSTHTIGTVVSTGTVLLTVVPENEPLLAQIYIRNDDIGFVHTHQNVKLKLAAYPFQKYGLLDGQVQQIWPDASDGSTNTDSTAHSSDPATDKEPAGFKALVSLNHQQLRAGGEVMTLVAGMQVVAEIREGRRTVLQYLLSPIQKAFYDGGRER